MSLLCLKDAGEKDGWGASQFDKGSSKEKQTKALSFLAMPLRFLAS